YGVGIRGPQTPGAGSIPVGRLVFYLSGVSGLPNEYSQWVDGGGSVPTNQWTHFAITYDGSAVRTYLNGGLTRTVSGLSGNVGVVSGSLRIGSRGPGVLNTLPLDRFNGIIDELDLFNRALPAAEIESIYLAGSAGKCVPTVSPPCT